MDRDDLIARLGYEIHTNRELGMMLRCEKPLAVFSDVEDAFPSSVLRYLRMFDRHVQTGWFIKREHRVSFDARGESRVHLTVLYALPAEAWRIDEMIGLRSDMSALQARSTAEQLYGRGFDEIAVWRLSHRSLLRLLRHLLDCQPSKTSRAWRDCRGCLRGCIATRITALEGGH